MNDWHPLTNPEIQYDTWLNKGKEVKWIEECIWPAIEPLRFKVPDDKIVTIKDAIMLQSICMKQIYT